MNRVDISIRTRNLPWRIWSCEASRVKSANVRVGGRTTWTKRFATVSRAVNEKETFNVRCGSSGGISVDIYNSKALSNPNTPLIIYFPPTGVHDRDKHAPIPKFLSNLPFASALAQVNYRWNIPASGGRNSSDRRSSVPLSSAVGYDIHPFPTPLHDTLFAYDFLTKTFLTSHNIDPSPSSNDISFQPSPTPPQKQIQRPLLLAGSFLGGTLATSLALTSTYASSQNPFRIVGLVTLDAVFDWSSIAASKAPSSSPYNDTKYEDGIANEESNEEVNGTFGGGWNSNKLHGLKKKLFASPAGAFDTFASPLLFFRTAGWAVPKHWVGETASRINDAGEVNRYSTSIEEDGGGEEEVSCSYGDIPISTTTTTIKKKTPPRREDQEPIAIGERKGEEKEDLGPEIARVSYLKFPPSATPTTSNSMSRYRNSRLLAKMQQLVIPRGLFLYSKDHGTTGSTGEEGTGVKGKKKGKGKKGKKGALDGDNVGGKMVGSGLVEEITSEGQAKDMARVMRRSVLLVEFKDRTVWDEGFDASGEAGRRVGVLDVVDGDGDGGGEKVGEWMEECLE